MSAIKNIVKFAGMGLIVGAFLFGPLLLADATKLKSGSYTLYDAKKIKDAVSGEVVLFFHASWCPTCKAVEKDVKAHLKDIPSSLTILQVDYDESKELKKKYGVTHQTTFVQVDPDGKLIKKWAGSAGLDDIVSEIVKNKRSETANPHAN